MDDRDLTGEMMASVILTHDGTVLKEYELTQGRTTIGRSPDNDIHLDDPTVSGKHAVIIYADEAILEDLKSTNGTRLNGNKVSRMQLFNRDLIGIGRHELEFIDQNADGYDKTVILKPGEVGGQDEQPKYFARIEVTSGPKSGETIELNKPFTNLGTPGAQVAVVARRGSDYFLMPMSGTGSADNRMKLNGKIVVGAKSQLLQHGDIIELAGIKLMFNASE